MCSVEFSKSNKPSKTIKVPNVIVGMVFGSALGAVSGVVGGTIAGVICDVVNIAKKFKK